MSRGATDLAWRLTRCTRATTAVEFALTFLPMALLVIGTIELGRALHVRNDMAFAADTAMRTMLLDPTTGVTDLTAAARGAFVAGRAADLSVTLNGAGAGDVQVLTLTYRLDHLPR
jgi:Flp pilus assembly protein TadG